MSHSPAESARVTVKRVRAKFRCDAVARGIEGQPSTVMLSPVYDADPNSENGKFFKATPWGKIELGTVNPVAAAAFVAGELYYVDFTRADGA